MKKLMIAAAIVCAAAMSQAATANWSTGIVYKPVNADGTKGSNMQTDLAKGANVYAFVIDKDTFDNYAKLTYAEAATQIWSDFGSGDKLDSATLLANAGKDANSKDRTAAMTMGMGTLAEGVNDNAGDLYRAFIITYSDANLGDFYIANIDQTNVGGSGTYSGVHGALGNTWAGTSGGAISSWNAVAVPEPTSGLLLLLGVAGMALRRRRA